MSISTPSEEAYTESNACSASINAAIPPCFWTSAIACIVNVVFPEDSGPYISITLPLGYPPTPSAKSRPIELAACKASLIDSMPNCLPWESMHRTC